MLEKHADFLRDFRGDTVHASTLTLLDELGLGERFAAHPAPAARPHAGAARQRQLPRRRPAAAAGRPPAHRAGAAVGPARPAGRRGRGGAHVHVAPQRRGARAAVRRAPRRRGPVGRPGDRGRARAARFGHGRLRRARLDGARGGRAATAVVRRADGRVVVPAAAARGRPAGRRRAVHPGPLLRADRPRRLLAVRLPHPQGQRRRAAGGGHRGAAAPVRHPAAVDGATASTTCGRGTTCACSTCGWSGSAAGTATGCC